MTADDRDPLDLLLEQFTSAVRRGEDTDVESWADRHPEHAAEIRELFPTVLAIEGLRDDSDRSGRRAPFGIGMIERLGDYRIVEEIGRGGMGVVYEAEQESLGRRVAVKVLPPMRDPRRVRRFEREARTAARLHHTNIVPIFGVGEHEGWHYYVMQVIRGVGLDVVLRTMRREEDSGAHGGTAHARISPDDAVRMLWTGRFHRPSRPASSDVTTSAPSSDPTTAGSGDGSPPLPALDTSITPEPRAPLWRSVAGIGRQVADALAYAHSQGVLHRDVKPGNLLIDQHGVVWVTDFGLAKAVGNEGLTLSGDLVGTLQYMAPEQLHGRYDARTDVYGLGLTLYELLTLRPAFADGDRGGLVKKIEQGNPTPPSQLRAGIPHDLETIVLKAIQHDPTHRYQTAAELADDLQRFLEDRPIRARRATVLEQAWRWCRRNRALASLAAIAFLAVAGAAITGWTSYVRLRASVVEIQRASAGKEANLKLALEAFEDVFDVVAGTDRLEIVVDQSGEDTSYEWYSPATVSAEGAALLERMLAFYDRFAEQNSDSPDLRLETAKAHRRVGDLLLQLGRQTDAEKAYQTSLAMFETLDAGKGQHRLTIGALHNDLGRVRMETSDAEVARADLNLALTKLNGETSRAGRFERARALELLGLLSFDRGARNEGPGEGRPPWLRRPDRDGPPRDPGSERGARRGDPGADTPPPERGGRRGDPARQDRDGQARVSQALDNFSKAYEITCALAEEQPENPAFQLAAARNGRHLLTFGFLPPRRVFGGSIDEPSKRSQIAAASVARLEALVAAHPSVALYRSELAQTCLAFVPRGRGPDGPRPGRNGVSDEVAKEGQTYVQRALALAEELHAAKPDDLEIRSLLAEALWQSARFDGAPASMRTALERAIALREGLGSDRRTNELRAALIGTLLQLDDVGAATAQLPKLDSDSSANTGDRNRQVQILRMLLEPRIRELRDRGKGSRALDEFEIRLHALSGR